MQHRNSESGVNTRVLREPGPVDSGADRAWSPTSHRHRSDSSASGDSACGTPSGLQGALAATPDARIRERAYINARNAERVLPTRPTVAAGDVFAHAGSIGHDRQHGSAGELCRKQQSAARTGRGRGKLSQLERAAEALGTEIAADERRCVERVGEVAGRAGKQSDGSAACGPRNREMTMAASAGPGLHHLFGSHRRRGYLGYQPRPIRLRRARPAWSDASRLHRSTPLRGARRWLGLDLEHRDPRPFSRQRAPQ